MSEPDSFEAVLDKLYYETERVGLFPSYYSDMLFALRKKHRKELQQAMRGFLEEGGLTSLSDMSEHAIRSHVLHCVRRDLIRRLKDYKADPYVLENDTPFEGGVVDFCALRAIIMWPETGWTADEFIDRLLYLLGDIDGKDD